MAFYSFIINRNLTLPICREFSRTRVTKTEFPSQLRVNFHNYEVDLFYIECKTKKELFEKLPYAIVNFALKRTNEICIYPYSEIYYTTAVNKDILLGVIHPDGFGCDIVIATKVCDNYEDFKFSHFRDSRPIVEI